jgi:hypothetical protein
MTSAELKTFREALGLPVAWLSKQAHVQERTVRYWESGRCPVPPDVAGIILAIDDRFNVIVSESVEHVMKAWRGIEVNDPGKGMTIVLIRYLTGRDLWHYQPDFRPLPVTAHAALLERMRRELTTEGLSVTITYLIPAEYERWRKENGLPDSQSSRSAWGAEQVANDESGG